MSLYLLLDTNIVSYLMKGTPQAKLYQNYLSGKTWGNFGDKAEFTSARGNNRKGGSLMIKRKVVCCKSYFWGFCKETPVNEKKNHQACKFEKCLKFKTKEVYR